MQSRSPFRVDGALHNHRCPRRPVETAYRTAADAPTWAPCPRSDDDRIPDLNVLGALQTQSGISAGMGKRCVDDISWSRATTIYSHLLHRRTQGDDRTCGHQRPVRKQSHA